MDRDQSKPSRSFGKAGTRTMVAVTVRPSVMEPTAAATTDLAAAAAATIVATAHRLLRLLIFAQVASGIWKIPTTVTSNNMVFGY